MSAVHVYIADSTHLMGCSGGTLAVSFDGGSSKVDADRGSGCAMLLSGAGFTSRYTRAATQVTTRSIRSAFPHIHVCNAGEG